MQNIFLKFSFLFTFLASTIFFQTDLLATPPKRYGFSGPKQGPEIQGNRPIRSVGAIVVSQEGDNFCFAVEKNASSAPSLIELPLTNVESTTSSEEIFAQAYDSNSSRLVKILLKKLRFSSNDTSLENRPFIVFDKENYQNPSYTKLSSPNTFTETDLVAFFFFKKDELVSNAAQQPMWETRDELNNTSTYLKKLFEISDRLDIFTNMYSPKNGNGSSGVSLTSNDLNLTLCQKDWLEKHLFAQNNNNFEHISTNMNHYGKFQEKNSLFIKSKLCGHISGSQNIFINSAIDGSILGEGNIFKDCIIKAKHKNKNNTFIDCTFL